MNLSFSLLKHAQTSSFVLLEIVKEEALLDTS